jgi:hypothetical protein
MNEDDKPAAAPHMDQLREHLMQTLASLRDRDHPMEPDRARAVAQVAGVLVDTAKVEIDFLKVTGQDRSTFIGQADQDDEGTTATTRLPGRTVHRLRG